MKIGVILPSRGLIFSQTADELLRNLEGLPHKIYFSHRKPIPECFETPVNEALKDPEITHIWMVEDDMILPQGILQKMLEADKNVVTYDYPVTAEGKGAVFYDQAKHPVYCGTGCLLIKRRVFDLIPKPYFTSDTVWTPLNYGNYVKFVGNKRTQEGYGLHDVNFGIKLWNAEVPITVIGKTGQRKLIAMGEAGTNNGAHQIRTIRKIKKDYQLKKIQSYPLALGAESTLITVDTPTGGVNVTKAHAEKLVEQGLATYPPKRYIIIDDRSQE